MHQVTLKTMKSNVKSINPKNKLSEAIKITCLVTSKR